MLRKAMIVTVLLLASMFMGAFAACGGNSSGTASASSGPVHLTFWSWVTGIDKSVALFNKTHPNIQVTLANVGAGPTEYDKLNTAIKANNEPDLAQVEFQLLPTFEATGSLVDLSQYGANAVKDQFVSWAWGQVSLGNAVYAIPQDSGPMALYYREDIFKKYNIAVPTTWAQYADAAAKLHAADPNEYITDFPPKQPGQFTGLVWQAGQTANGNWGGSTTVAFKDTKHPKEATEFATWLNTNQSSLDAMIKGNNIYPAYQPALESPLVNGPQSFFGNQNIGPIFKDGSAHVNVQFQWGPTINQVYSDLGDNFANAVIGKGTLLDALNIVQQSTVTFMKKQGFSVST